MPADTVVLPLAFSGATEFSVCSSPWAASAPSVSNLLSFSRVAENADVTRTAQLTNACHYQEDADSVPVAPHIRHKHFVQLFTCVDW
ncbi:MAG: hypothetical protein QM578_23845 [Pantoea sp.]|uniref:hypothetical protein n=1 Tax=Pantoea sp. TaxID=69393 RepID=UPI0039E3295C